MTAKTHPHFVLFAAGLALLLFAACQSRGRSTELAGLDATEGSSVPEATQSGEPTLPPATAEQPTAPPPSPTEAPPEPTASPREAATATPSPTATPEPTMTPTPTATATEPPPEWLSYLNYFRAMADLPLLSESEPYTAGSSHHSRYMVVNDDPTAHSEDSNNPRYDPSGDQAARNGNLFATSQLDANYRWSLNFWASAPFHVIGMLDPRLKEVGYGDYVEDVGSTKMAAVLDIRSDPREAAEAVDYPITFPADGSETWIVRHTMYEWPDTFGSCPGYSRPTGPAIVLLLGDGSRTPRVYSHSFSRGYQVLESCLFDETSYVTGNAYEQQTGRSILDLNDAIVIMPREPLEGGQTYTVQVTLAEGTYTWSFDTGASPE